MRVYTVHIVGQISTQAFIAQKYGVVMLIEGITQMVTMLIETKEG